MSYAQKINTQFMMRFSLLIVLFLVSNYSFSQKKSKKSKPAEQQIVLADNQSSRYSILIPAHATNYEQKAAKVLQDYLMQIAGAALPIVTADAHRSPYEIVLGQNERIDELSTGINYQELK